MKWPEYSLSEVADRFLSGGTPSTKVPEYWIGNIPLITGADFSDGEVTLGRRYISQTAVDNSATNEYICWLLNMPSTLLLAHGLFLGQTRTRVSMGRLRELRVPVPLLELQQQFAKHVKFWNLLIESQDLRADHVEALFRAVLCRAFTGDLTAKWRVAHMKELLDEMEKQSNYLGSLQ